LNFPADVLVKAKLTKEIYDCFNIKPRQAFKGKTDYLLLFENENEIKALVPRLNAISGMDCRGIIVTARGENVDFVSRFFGPNLGLMKIL